MSHNSLTKNQQDCGCHTCFYGSELYGHNLTFTKHPRTCLEAPPSWLIKFWAGRIKLTICRFDSGRPLIGKKPPLIAQWAVLLFRPGNALQFGTRFADGIGHFEFFEVFDELAGQLFGCGVVGILVCPGVARVEQAGINARYFCGHIQVDDVQVLGFGVGNGAALDGYNHAASRQDVEALADTVAAAGPAGVDQINLGAKSVDALDQQLGIDTGRTREERCAKAGGEGGLDAPAGTHFGGTHQGRVTGQEVVGRLFVVEDGHRRQYAGQVAGQEDDGVGLAGTVFGRDFFDVGQRVGGTGVLGQAVVGVIGRALVVQHDVFEHGAKLDGFPDDRFVFLGQVDALGVAATLDVEDGAHAPAVLVVADQVAAFVGRQGGLAGAGQAEEQCGIAVFADVGGTVHGQYILLGQQEVLHGEHGLFHFAGVTHAGNQDFFGGEVDHYGAVGVGAVTLGHALEKRRVDDLPLGLAGRVVLFRGDEQATAKQVVPGGGGGHFDRQVITGIRTYMYVGDEAVTLGHIGLDTLPQGVEHCRLDRAVDRAPGNLCFGAGLFDDVAVGRGTAGTVTGLHHQRTVVSQFAFATLNGLFNKFSSTDVSVNIDVCLRHVDPQRPRRLLKRCSALQKTLHG